ncbi:MAG: DNA polymerase I, partial [Pirellulales bacterium]|nr:DNA polymerase I [Pirellulales bacterium]
GVLRSNWEAIQDQLISSIDRDYGIFDGRTFKTDRFVAWLTRKGIAWPTLPTGSLDLSEDTFREMARSHAEVAPISQLRHALSQLRLSELAVGSDGRNRCLLSAFQARTGRNQPSNSKFIFGPSVWLRGLIQPPPGHAVAYLDYEQQEFGIAAALSKDEAMQAAYASGDPYLAFAKQAGAVPEDATKATHKHERDLFKACVLAVQYGMGAKSLAERIGQPECQARELLRLHQQTYPTYWKWSGAAVDHAMLWGWLHTVFGWRVHVEGDANARSLANFPMQGNGAEMLRLACCMATERGIKVCAPVHDALLIEATIDDIDRAVAETESIMAEASRIVLDGFELRTEAKVVRYPERYMDPRGERFWQEVMSILGR